MSKHFNIASLFFAAAAKYPDNIAIIHKNKQITYKQLSEAVRNTAHYFRRAGLKKGDRVLVFVPMSIDLYRIVLALFSMGVVAVFLDEWVNKKRMEICCRIAQCQGFIGITKARLLRFVSKELRRIPIDLNLKKSLPATSSSADFVSSVPQDTALITFTTGSTGIPKAAKRTHGFLNEQFRALIEKMDPQPADVDMPVLPIVLLINLGIGATSVIVHYKTNRPQSLKPNKISATIQKHGVNRITASPFFLKIVSVYVMENRLRLPSVKKIFTGGAPVFPKEAELYTQAFTHAQIEIVYGSTEAEPVSGILADELIKEKDNILSRGLPAGKPWRKAEVCIINYCDTVITANSIDELPLCKTGQPGEIIVAGPHVLSEYFNNEQALLRNKIFINGKVYHRTGDCGYLNIQGQLYLMGRCGQVFTKGNTSVYPFLMENYLQTLDGVNIGTVLQHKGKTLVLLELKDKSKKPAIIAGLKNSVLRFDAVLFLRKIPRDPRHHSKIDYAQLKKKLT